MTELINKVREQIRILMEAMQDETEDSEAYAYHRDLRDLFEQVEVEISKTPTTEKEDNHG